MNRACGKSTKLDTRAHEKKKVNVAIVPSQISHVGDMAAIFKNGRNVTISLKLRGEEPSLSTLYIGFLGRRFQKKYCRIHHAIVSAILEAIYAKWRQFTK